MKGRDLGPLTLSIVCLKIALQTFIEIEGVKWWCALTKLASARVGNCLMRKATVAPDAAGTTDDIRFELLKQNIERHLLHFILSLLSTFENDNMGLGILKSDVRDKDTPLPYLLGNSIIHRLTVS